jgi:hypothetical protein
MVATSGSEKLNSKAREKGTPKIQDYKKNCW